MSSPLTKIMPGSIDRSTDTRVLQIAEDEAHMVLKAFGSEMSRQLYAQLCRDPATPSELADALNTSLQNLSYHLDKLEKSGLITAAGTRYSSRGHEMTLYKPRHDPLVFTGDTDSKMTLESALPRVLSGLAVVSGLGLLGEWARRTFNLFGPGGNNVGTAGVDTSAEGTHALLSVLFEPTVLLLIGGLLMAAVIFVPELR